MTYRLIVTDIDGTLLSRQGAILPATRAELARARKAGATWALASGRPLSGLRRLLRAMHLDPEGLVLIGVNGAVVAHAGSGEVVSRRTLNPEVARRICTVAADFPVTPMLSDADHLIVDDPQEQRVQFEVEGNEVRLVHLPDLTQVDVPLDKVLMCGAHEVLLELAQAVRTEVADVTETSFSAPYYFEVTAAGVDKGSAVRLYTEAAGIDLSEVVAFGDNDNDLPMIEVAGLGVAMGNAIGAVTAAADRITASHDDDGIALVLADLFGDGVPAPAVTAPEVDRGMYPDDFSALVAPRDE